jgi:ATP-dependent DNA ligase
MREFAERTSENHLRQARFVALRGDKKAKDMRGEA